MPLKTFSALSSTTSFFLPLGILNSPQNLSKLKGSLQIVQVVQDIERSEAVERLKGFERRRLHPQVHALKEAYESTARIRKSYSESSTSHARKRAANPSHF